MGSQANAYFNTTSIHFDTDVVIKRPFSFPQIIFICGCLLGVIVYWSYGRVRTPNVFREEKLEDLLLL